MKSRFTSSRSASSAICEVSPRGRGFGLYSTWEPTQAATIPSADAT
jgi:hypothetical protein